MHCIPFVSSDYILAMITHVAKTIAIVPHVQEIQVAADSRVRSTTNTFRQS